jgi:hypothetical protein
MSNEKEKLTVYGYADNRGEAYHGKGVAEPLVHLLTSHCGDTQSISFHPFEAQWIANAINAAAEAAMRGRDYEKTVHLTALDN